MDLNTVAVETRSTPEPEWNEDKLVLSLTRLQEMHAQLRYLRETIPRILDPLLIHQSSPEVLYASFSQAAVGAFKDVKDFSKLIEDSRSRTILERAKESRAESSEGITGWKVTEHKDWLDVRREASPKDSADGLDDGNSQVNGSSEEDLRAALKKFEGNHAGIETSLATDGSNVMEAIKPSNWLENAIAN
ncbi:hypothetical protein MMC22_005470 [Lobaria immixta]|nr:hypothetical protein [Lobaria immixta]